MAETLNDWYPSHLQLDTPQKLERTLREVLRLHYAQRDTVNALHTKVNAPTVAGTRASQVPTNTAAVTNILGLPIVPSDTTQLADGTKLTYVKATRSFKFL